METADITQQAPSLSGNSFLNVVQSHDKGGFKDVRKERDRFTQKLQGFVLFCFEDMVFMYTNYIPWNVLEEAQVELVLITNQLGGLDQALSRLFPQM